MTQELSTLVSQLLSDAECISDVTSPELVESKMHEIAEAQDDIEETVNSMRKNKNLIAQQIADLQLMSSRLSTAKDKLRDRKFALIRQRKDSRADV